MTKATTKVNSEELADCVIEGIKDKKGLEIVKLDLRELGNSISDFFVICHGSSDRQVSAIAESVTDLVKKSMNDSPNAVEGRSNAEWILIDFVDVVVHVFQEDVRTEFALEDLWADAGVERITDK